MSCVALLNEAEGRVAVRLTTAERCRWRLERRRVVGVGLFRILAWSTRPQTVAHGTQKLDASVPAVVELI